MLRLKSLLTTSLPLQHQLLPPSRLLLRLRGKSPRLCREHHHPPCPSRRDQLQPWHRNSRTTMPPTLMMTPQALKKLLNPFNDLPHLLQEQCRSLFHPSKQNLQRPLHQKPHPPSNHQPQDRSLSNLPPQCKLQLPNQHPSHRQQVQAAQLKLLWHRSPSCWRLKLEQSRRKVRRFQS